MTIEINAFDTLFFKDGKPFSMGEDVWASGIFPPAPSVFYGMLQTTYAAQQNIAPKQIAAETQNLRISGIYLKLNDELLFPIPADVFATKNSKESGFKKEAKRLRMKDNISASCLSGKGFSKILHANTNEKIKDYFGKAFLNKINFDEYANGSKAVWFYQLSDFLSSEAKVGLGKELASNTTSEGKLYRVGMVRPEAVTGKGKNYKLKFVIDFDGINLSEKSNLLRLGAEYKTAYFNSIQRTEIPLPKITSEYLCLYLATPAVFENGAFPAFFKEKSFDGIEFEMLSCALGKAQYLGGFDMVKRYPKPMKKVVPAGSVYYLKSKQADLLAQKLHNTSISELESAKIGFGKVFIGNLDIDEI